MVRLGRYSNIRHFPRPTDNPFEESSSSRWETEIPPGWRYRSRSETLLQNGVFGTENLPQPSPDVNGRGFREAFWQERFLNPTQPKQ